MRKKFKLVLLIGPVLVAASSSYGESTSDHYLKQWRREVTRECPRKHIESASISKMNSLIGVYDDYLSPSERTKAEKIADQLERSVCGPAGQGCRQMAYIYSIQKVGKLRNLVKAMCEHAPSCRSPSDCE